MKDNFTVISWANSAYEYLADNLRKDCERIGYKFHLYNIEKSFKTLTSAWCMHPHVIKRGVEDFGKVLFLDVECRILKSIPDNWKVPLVSVRKPYQPFWIKFNTGTVLVDTTCLKWIDSWINIIERWKMDSMENDDFIRYPNDICDELAFHAAVAAHNVTVNTADLEYFNRNTKAEITRGYWSNEYTIIQHPTIHHWCKVRNPAECKILFYQNYPGDKPEEIEKIFLQKNNGNQYIRKNQWIFDVVNKKYTPEIFPDQFRDWFPEKVILSASQR